MLFFSFSLTIPRGFWHIIVYVIITYFITNFYFSSKTMDHIPKWEAQVIYLTAFDLLDQASGLNSSIKSCYIHIEISWSNGSPRNMDRIGRWSWWFCLSLVILVTLHDIIWPANFVSASLRSLVSNSIVMMSSLYMHWCLMFVSRKFCTFRFSVCVFCSGLSNAWIRLPRLHNSSS